jgi:broad specificity phosphatase PhoE
MEIIFVRHGHSTQNLAYEKNEEYDATKISLTKVGEEQAKITGNYLKMYGTFDAIYTSPLLRAIQTAQIIKEQIKFKKDINVDARLEEHNLGITEGKKQSDVVEYINRNKELVQLLKMYNNESNLYKKQKINQLYSTKYFAYVKSSLTYEEQIINVKKFLNYLKKTNYKRVLVVSHGGIMDVVSSIVNNINIYNHDIKITLMNPEKKIYMGNCDIIGLLYENKKLSLVIPRNNIHLQK